MINGLLYFHQGWTDIMNCLALINYYCNIYNKIFLLVRKEAEPLIEFYTSNIKNIFIVYQDKETIDKINLKNFKLEYGNGILKNTDSLFIGCHDIYREDKYKGKFNSNLFFVNSFYLRYDIPFITRINDFEFQRNYELEDKTYQNFINKNGSEYILYHHVIKNYNKNIKIINLDNQTNIFFDFLKIIEKSVELHLLDSIWGAFIYQVDAKYKLFKNKKIFLYADRGYTKMFTEPITLKNWIII